MEKVFKTKTGFCHITKDRILLTRDGVIGKAAKIVIGNNIVRILIVYGITSVGLLYLAYESYLKKEIFTAAIFAVATLYLINGIFKSLNNSATADINRKNIKTTKFIKGISGLTRSRFEIEFTEKGKTKKRVILLPGSIAGGAIETTKAVEIMREEKLLN